MTPSSTPGSPQQARTAAQAIAPPRGLPLGLERVSQAQLLEFAAIALQLGLVLLAARLFRLEEGIGLQRILPIVFGGFVVHAFLPFHLRRPFFLLLSFAAIGVVFGFPHNLGLIALGLGLIGICHLPIAFGVRVALLVGVAGVLAAVRTGRIETPWESLPTLVLPILGSMFMFRLIIYLYDLRHEKKPASLWERLSYFFLLPNVCFPLFPVIDYQTYRRSYYDREANEIYRKGVSWILRGTLHLLFYRVVYQYFVLAPEQVVGLGGVVQWMLTTYLLYLRISGQFHLIIGILCLFGFNLPETHHLYFFASSFTDYWRRINIYWKDFMMKIFYYPALMRLRGLGMTTALVLATLVVFLGTWLLHSYQWLWLRGSFPIAGPDMLFWGILGGLVVLNSLREAKRGRKRTLGKPEWSVRAAAVTSLRTVGMFVFITVLWSLWSSPTIGQWVSLVGEAGASGPGAWAALAGGLAALVAVGTLGQFLTHRAPGALEPRGPRQQRGGFALTTALALLLVLLGLPQARGVWGAEAGSVLATVSQDRLNARDVDRMERGYYEGLLDAERYTSALWTPRAERPDDWINVRASDFVRAHPDDILEFDLVPSYVGNFKRAAFTTNQWGLRDREYSLAPAPGVHRIALIGSSYAFGSGVGDEEVFESLLEERMNREHAGGRYAGYEVLNFSVGGYSVLHGLTVVQRRAFEFSPDLLLWVLHTSEESRLLTHLTNLVRHGTEVRDPFLSDLLQRVGVDPGTDPDQARRRLIPHTDEIIRWSLQQVALEARERGVPAVMALLPRTEEVEGMDRARAAQLLQVAREAGFVTLDLDGAYLDHPTDAVRLAEWDSHPNPLGHQLLADALYRALRENEATLGLGLADDPMMAASPVDTTHQPHADP